MNNTRGIMLMIASMVTFTMADTCMKLASTELPPGELMFFMGLGGMVIFGVWSFAKGHGVFGLDFFSRVFLLRNLGELVGMFGIITALALMPISSVSAIMQAAPLMVTMGAALFLREPVGWRRWTAITCGFLGVLMIIRPGLDGFQAASLFAIMGVFGQSLRDLSTRAVPKAISSLRIAFYGVFSITVLGLVLMATTQPPVMPSATSWPLIFGMILLGSVGYHMLNVAIRMGDVSVVIPFRYSRILFGILGGVLVFSERPDFWTYLGSAVIIASGLYSFGRERRQNARG